MTKRNETEAVADVPVKDVSAIPLIERRLATMRQQRQQGQQQMDALLQQRQGIDQKINELSKMDWSLAGGIAQLESLRDEMELEPPEQEQAQQRPPRPPT